MRKSNLKIVLSDRVQEILDNFAEILGLRLSFFDLNGVMLRRGLRMRNCEYCRMIQEELGRLPRCVATDSMMMEKARREGGVIHYTCHAGLGEMVAPVIISGEEAGYLMIGQFRDTGSVMPGEGMPDGEVRRRLAGEFENVPLVPAKKAEAIVGLMLMLLDYLAARELATVSGDRLRYDVERFIARNITGDIRLPAAARALGRSVSGLTHELKKRYHVTFSQLLARARVERAEAVMLRTPEAGISEVAMAVGIDDPYYFSRLYRKIRGFPPSEFRMRSREKVSGSEDFADRDGGNAGSTA